MSNWSHESLEILSFYNQVVHTFAVHGNWGRWLDWGMCSKSCEAGITTRIRLCNNPSPLYGGRQCNGSVLEEDICNDIKCPGKVQKIM